jgi:lon-related putative ATP-dependent protease
MTDVRALPASPDGPASASPGRPLEAERLRRRCDPAALGFASTDELPDPPLLFEQERAVAALGFALAMRRPGYNVFVYGPPGSGRHTLVGDIVRRQAAGEPAPADHCYVNNFADARRPRLLRLPAGRGAGLRDAMRHLVEELRTALPAAFEREDYRVRRDLLDQQFKHRHEKEFKDFNARAEAESIAVIRTPMGLALAPMRNGKVVDPEVFKRLSEADRAQIRERIEALQAELEAIMRKIPETEREHRAALRELNRATTAAAVGHLLEELRQHYADLHEVTAYLGEVEANIEENADEFLIAGRGEGESARAMRPDGPAEPISFRRYQVNLLVDHAGAPGAPVVYEDNPTHQALVGRIEHMARFGTLSTDFTLLTPGALHRANGGYLILDAERLLTAAFAWPSLKRALRSREIRIESLEQMLSLASTVSLDPEPAPLEVKVVLVGAPLTYLLLTELDPEFEELFKVAAEFDDRMVRSPENDLAFARAVAALARQHKLRALDAAAVAAVIEEAARAIGDAARLATDLRGLVELLAEADHHAAAAGRTAIGVAEIEAAIATRRHRADRLQRRLQEATLRGTLRIETEGAEVGQVNGLSVLSVGGYGFGHPVRITARARLGRGEVIDVEREVALGGPLHSKGVLILTGFIAGRYGRDAPLALSASLVFEQSYGSVEGDSASAAELLALLSAIAEVPLRQSLAVTGSVDQRGLVQAIGGVNEKIEGFFELCAARGLTGTQGVLIPAANNEHLMLRREVVEAAAAGRFHIHPIATIDDALALLTGIPAGAADLAGDYPPGTINHMVMSRLAAFAARGAARQAAALALRGHDLA